MQLDIGHCFQISQQRFRELLNALSEREHGYSLHDCFHVTEFIVLYTSLRNRRREHTPYHPSHHTPSSSPFCCPKRRERCLDTQLSRVRSIYPMYQCRAHGPSKSGPESTSTEAIKTFVVVIFTQFILWTVGTTEWFWCDGWQEQFPANRRAEDRGDGGGQANETRWKRSIGSGRKIQEAVLSSWRCLGCGDQGGTESKEVDLGLSS
jgi:hypothetical protein